MGPEETGSSAQCHGLANHPFPVPGSGEVAKDVVVKFLMPQPADRICKLWGRLPYIAHLVSPCLSLHRTADDFLVITSCLL